MQQIWQGDCPAMQIGTSTALVQRPAAAFMSGCSRGQAMTLSFEMAGMAAAVWRHAKCKYWTEKVHVSQVMIMSSRADMQKSVADCMAAARALLREDMQAATRCKGSSWHIGPRLWA